MGLIFLSLLSLLMSEWVYTKEIEDPWSLPVLPPHPFGTSFNISKNIWIAVRDADNIPRNSRAFITRNPEWRANVVSNEMKDKFMNRTFAGTRLLWIYHMIHPIASVAKADLWRYAVLWTHGGVYLDDDSELFKPLNEAVRSDDQLIFGIEKNKFDGDRCYIPQHHLTDIMTSSIYYIKPDTFFHGRILVNWAIFANAGNEVLATALENSVEILMNEYNRTSLLRHGTHAWEIIGCATGPPLLTASAREVLLKQGKKIRYRLAGIDYRDFDGRFKVPDAPRPRDNPNHYMNHFRYHLHTDLLIHYLPERSVTAQDLTRLEGTPIQAQRGGKIFLVESGKLRKFPSWQTFISYNFSMINVTVLSESMIRQFREGRPLPKVDE